jgi:precorrin-6B methylase 2
MKASAVSQIKSQLVKDESRVRECLFGLYKGLKFHINLRSQSQLYFVDIGAGSGELCVVFALAPAVRRIVAVEPNGAEVANLLSNISANLIAAHRVEVLEKFAGTKDDSDYVAVDALGMSTSIPGLIKIDVDGFELDVLESGRKLIENGNCELLVEVHSFELERACIAWLSNRGYRCEVIKNAWWRRILPEHRPIAHNRWLFASRGRSVSQSARPI